MFGALDFNALTRRSLDPDDVVHNIFQFQNIFAAAFTVLLSFALLIPAYIINRWFPFVLGRRRKSAVRAG